MLMGELAAKPKEFMIYVAKTDTRAFCPISVSRDHFQETVKLS
jgi:hypothetical protein